MKTLVPFMPLSVVLFGAALVTKLYVDADDNRNAKYDWVRNFIPHWPQTLGLVSGRLHQSSSIVFVK